MHVTPKAPEPVTLVRLCAVHALGSDASPRLEIVEAHRRTYPSLDALVADLSHGAARSLRDDRGDGIVVLDRYGDIVPAARVKALRDAWCAAHPEVLPYWARLPRYTFRNGPVPHTGRRGRYGWFRHPKTTQERRSACIDGTGDPRPRAKRNLRNLVHAWDDIGRHVERNWKRHRRTQWKERGRH